MPAFPSLIDPALPALGRALDRTEMRTQTERLLPKRFRDGQPTVEIESIRLVRHKPGLRCLIEYGLHVTGADSRARRVPILGKMRTGAVDRRTYGVMRKLWAGGFDTRSEDRISVPEPAGLVPELQMWLQLKAPGLPASDVLAGSHDSRLASSIADAIHKLHVTGPPADRRHTIADELRILQNRLQQVEALRPEWSTRLRRLFQGCMRLTADLPEPRWTGIHRDFYPDQMLVGPDGRLYLLDFDLYAQGDPALDAGNFIGHLIELAIRHDRTSSGAGPAIAAFESRFLELTGDSVRRAIDVYVTLTLARHIFLSTQFIDRRHTTERLLELCAERISRVERSGTRCTDAYC